MNPRYPRLVIRIRRALVSVCQIGCHLFRLLEVLSGERIFGSESGFVNAVSVYRCADYRFLSLYHHHRNEIRDAGSTLKITKVDSCVG